MGLSPAPPSRPSVRCSFPWSLSNATLARYKTLPFSIGYVRSMKTFNLQKCALLVAFAACAASFWGLRVLYWSEVSEAPFSDLLDYVTVGRNIYEHFFW